MKGQTPTFKKKLSLKFAELEDIERPHFLAMDG